MGRDAEDLAHARRACLTAPAGFGKTYVIAEAVTDHCDQLQLLLTHTHAGVRAMRSRLAAMGCPPSRYRVETISGWALGFASAYPHLSGVAALQPTTPAEWRQVYRGARALLSSRALRRMLEVSYAGLFVDEYQDCTQSQHQLVVGLADILPCRILGDPLQGIFDFEGEPVDWATDVEGQFQPLPQLQTPHRWQGKNVALGNWLSHVRQQLKARSPVDMCSRPAGVDWRSMDAATQRAVCFDTANRVGTIAAIHAGDLDGPCQHLARSLGGRYQSMEPVECRDLYKWSAKIETSTGAKRAGLLIDFACVCMAGLKTELKNVSKHLMRPSGPRGAPLRKHLSVLAALQAVATSTAWPPVLGALQAIHSVPAAKLFRRELWDSLKTAIKDLQSGESDSLVGAARAVRDRVRRYGRAAELRTVSRTLLVKGLEYDHAIVLDADKLDTKQLYVALTRGSRTLTVLSSTPILRPT